MTKTADRKQTKRNGQTQNEKKAKSRRAKVAMKPSLPPLGEEAASSLKATPAERLSSVERPNTGSLPAHQIIPGDAKVTVLVKENPRRAGTLAARTFDLFFKAKTVGEWRKLCERTKGDVGYLHSDLRKGYIKVSF